MVCSTSTNVSFSNPDIIEESVLIYLQTVRILDREGPFTCDKCGSKLTTRKSFQSHIYKSHQSYKKCFACDMCGFKTEYKGNLQSHMLTHYRVECPICHKKVAALRYHLKNHKTEHRPKEQCQVCHKMCSKSNIERHMRIHSKETQRVERCCVAFESKSDSKE